MHIDDLPLELSDCIIDMLGGHRQSLKNCALARRAWLSRCRTWLHCDILVNTNRKHAIQRVTTRYAKPELRNLVRKITIQLAPNANRRYTVKVDLPQVVTSLFQHFSPDSIHQISMVTTRPNFYPQRHNAHVYLPLDPVQDGITFTLRCWEYPFVFIDMLKVLRSIPRLSHIDFAGNIYWGSEDSWSEGASGDVLTNFKTLALDIWEYESTDPEFGIRDRFLRWLHSGRDHLALTSVLLTGHYSSEVNHFLSMCSDTIEELMIDTPEESQDEEILQLCSPSLHEMDLVSSIDNSRWAISSLVSCSFPSLVDLTLEFTIYAVDQFIEAGWLDGRFDDELAVICSKTKKFTLIFLLKPLDGGDALITYPIIGQTIEICIQNCIPRTSSSDGFNLDLVVL